MSLRIDVLGTPRIEIDGEPLRVDTRKAVALLAHLAVTGGPQARDLLVDLLWPDTDPDRGRAALRRTLSSLRSALGGRWVTVSRAAVMLDVEPDAVDVARFRALAAAAGDGQAAVEPLAAAVALHRDDLLAGFGVRDSVRFDDWQRDTAAELRAELERALDRLVAALEASGRPDDAIPHARRRLALDALHEPAHRTLIRLYAASGRRSEALSQYRDCVRVLDRELGVRPLAETTEIYNAVNEGRPVETPVAEAASAAAPAAAPVSPLVGRAGEWEAVVAEHGACGPDGRLVIIEGEAGVGKTRLGEDLAAAARAGGNVAAVARSHEGEAGIAFGLVAAAIRAALDAAGEEPLATVPAHWRAEAARLVPEIGGEAPAAPDSAAAQQRLYEGLAHVIAALTGSRPPGLLFLDDLQFADPASLAMVGYLVRRLAGRPILVAAAWRSEEIGADHAVLRRSADRVIRLGRLTRADVAELATAAGIGARASELFDETEGLPLFVVEYLAALTDPAQDGGLPVGVRELLTARLDGIGEASLQLLTAAAVIGRTFDVDTVRAAAGRGEDETAAGLEELTRRGLLVERDAGYEFSHDKLLAVAYERAGLARRRLLHRRVAETLTVGHADPALVARHLLAAGHEAEAAEAFRRAGDRARSVYAHRVALDAYRSAIGLGHDQPALLHEAIGDLHTLRGEYAAALSAYEAAAALGEPGSVAGIEHKLGRVHDRRGDPELADRHLLEALRLGGESARVQADRSLAAHRRGDSDAAAELARRSLELGEAADDPEAVAQACNILGMLTGSREHLERSVELAEALPDRSVLVAALNNLALACGRSGETETAVAHTSRALDLCSEQGDRHREAALHNNLADLLHRAGREPEAMEHLKRAVTLFAEVGDGEAGMQPEVWKLVEW
ncbi:MAG TPA: BTAD domain-containing putative transcriptional regulator [Gaiellales bacterium]|nr:BTAD domain-containing putative transcriptional regulator [Gaiellales bacterium]